MKFSVRGDARWPRDEVRACGLKRELHPTEIWEKSENSLIFFSFTERNFVVYLYLKFETIKKGQKGKNVPAPGNPCHVISSPNIGFISTYPWRPLDKTKHFFFFIFFAHN